MSEYPDDAETRRQARERQPAGPPSFPRRAASPAASAETAAPPPEWTAEGPPSHPYRPLVTPATEPRLLLRRADEDAAEEPANFARQPGTLDEPERQRRLPSLLAGFSRRLRPDEDERRASAPPQKPVTTPTAPLADLFGDLPSPAPGDSRFPMRRVSPGPYPPENARAYRSFPAEAPTPLRPAERPVTPSPASFLEAYRAAETRLTLPKSTAVEARRWREAVFAEAPAEEPPAPAEAHTAELADPLEAETRRIEDLRPFSGARTAARQADEIDERLQPPVVDWFRTDQRPGSDAEAREHAEETAPGSEPLGFREFADEQEAASELRPASLDTEAEESARPWDDVETDLLPAPAMDGAPLSVPFEDTKRLEETPRRAWVWEPAPEPEDEKPFISAAEQSRAELFAVEAFQEETRRMEPQTRRTWTWAARGSEPVPGAEVTSSQPALRTETEEEEAAEPSIHETRRLGVPEREAAAEHVTILGKLREESLRFREAEALFQETRRLGDPSPAVTDPGLQPEAEMMRNRDQDDLNDLRRLVLTPEPILPHHSAEEPLPETAADAGPGEPVSNESSPTVSAAVADDAPVAAPPARGPAGGGEHEADDDLSPARVRASRLVLRIALIVLLLILLALAFLAGWAGLLRRSMNNNLPQLDGREPVAGLRAAVTVERNAQGVPTLTAGSLDDLVFAEAYVTASDRMWQMDGLRRHAGGRLAEILGSSQVDHDRLQRVLGLRYTADKAVAAMGSEDRHMLEVYAAGVNAYLREHHGDLPLEFHLLGYSPEPWQPRDSVLVAMALYQDLSTEFASKLARESLTAHLAPELARDLYPVGSWRDHPPGEAIPDLTSPRQVEEIPLDPTQSQLSPAPSVDPVGLAELARATQPCKGCTAGSNEWAVAGSRTASGKPLLANDMHLGLNVPDIWYEARLRTPLPASDALDVEGFTLPGLPFVIVGRNRHLAWGITNLTGDVQDVRVEHLRGSGESTEFKQADGTWRPAKVRTEVIKVRGGLDQKLEVTTVTHRIGSGDAGDAAAPTTELETPVLTPVLKGETRALSLSWTALDPANLNLPFLAADSAQNGNELVAAMGRLGGPPLNLAYADDAGLIGWHAMGRIPVRGPAVRHPRAVTPLMLAPAAPGTGPDEPQGEPDEDPGTVTDRPGTKKAAPEFRNERFERLVGAHPRLLLAGFARAPQAGRRGRAAAHGKAPAARARTAAEPAPRGRRPPAVPARSARARVERAMRPERPKPLPVEQAEVPAPTAQLDYTIGSPIPVVPADALDAAADWSGYVPYNAMPQVQNPATGFVATANSRVTADDYPYPLATNWVDPYRTDRIVHMLARRKGLTAEDMLHMELDVQSDMDQIVAERLAYALDHASAKALGGDKDRLRDAADLLRRFDGRMVADSPGAAVEWTIRRRLPAILIEAAIRQHDGEATSAGKAATLTQLYLWREDGSAFENIIGHQPARWLPAGYANWNDFLAAACEQALKDGGAPAKLATWKLGDVHRMSIEHPVLAMIPGLPKLLGISAGSGLRPIPGYRETVRASDPHFGSSERFTADLGEPMDSAAGAVADITTGESGNPRSAYYLDQMEAWFAGTVFPLVGEAKHTLTLEPR